MPVELIGWIPPRVSSELIPRSDLGETVCACGSGQLRKPARERTGDRRELIPACADTSRYEGSRRNRYGLMRVPAQA